MLVDGWPEQDIVSLPHSSPQIPPGPGPEAQLSILKQLNSEIFKNRCTVGPGGKSVGYFAHGTVTDWMFVDGGVPFASTWEIYGDLNAPYDDCFRMFNPLTKQVRQCHMWFETATSKKRRAK